MVDRDELVLRYLPLARKIALNAARALPPHLDREDLVQEATVGLIDAASRFDPSKGTPFASFAYARMRGHMIDFLRSNDGLGRGQRSKHRAYERAMAELMIELQREPTIDEVAAHLQITRDRLLETIRISYSGVHAISLEEPVVDDESITVGDALASEDRTLELLEAHERSMMIREAISRMRPAYRTVMENLLAGRPLRVAASALGVCDSRVSQIKTEAIRDLRQVFAAA